MTKEAKYNPDVPLDANNINVKHNSAKGYYLIVCQNRIIWSGEKGDALLDLEDAVKQFYKLRSKENKLVRFNATMNRYADPQPNSVQFVNAFFKYDVSLKDVLQILNDPEELKKYKQYLEA